jgi:hypothetical protein
MVSEAAELNIVTVTFDSSLYQRPDVLARLGALQPGDGMVLPPFFETSALQVLVDALLPGQFLWEAEYDADQRRSLRVTRL